MGTTATIAIEKDNGEVLMVYCHYDGYISHTGRILSDHYNSSSAAIQLVEMGGFSALKKTIVETNFYHRDEKENLKIDRFLNFEAYRFSGRFLMFNYLFSRDGVWLVKTGEYGAFSPLLGLIDVDDDHFPDRREIKQPLRVTNGRVQGW